MKIETSQLKQLENGDIYEKDPEMPGGQLSDDWNISALTSILSLHLLNCTFL